MKLIINTDAGREGDDLNALSLILQSKKFDVVAILTETGNVWASEAEVVVREHLKAKKRTDIQVICGSDFESIQPIESGTMTKYIGALATMPSTHVGKASEALVDLVQAHRGDVCIANLSPLYNVASALSLDPRLFTRICHTFFYGGAWKCRGNATSYAEFNVWFNAVSANQVLRNTGPATLITQDASEDQYIPPGYECDSKPLFRVGKQAYDELVAAAMLEPNLVDLSVPNLSVRVEPSGEYRGLLRTSTGGNVRLVARMKPKVLSQLSTYC